MNQLSATNTTVDKYTVHEDLRILILSTPKTGNTWLSRLLGSIYDLPQAGLVVPFDANQARALGRRWVLFHHLRPTREILDWIEETKPTVITCIRHPADVLVSLYYHLRAFESGAIDSHEARTMLAGAYLRNDIVSDATDSFLDDLECSLSWMRTGIAQVVRYEDLWRDAYTELTRLTGLIAAAPARNIEIGIERCDFSLMRRLAGKHGGFFRSGQAGGWVDTLPQEVIDELAMEPYLSLIQELGYSMDKTDAATAAPRVSRAPVNPFERFVSEDSVLDEPRFDNDVPVSALVVDLYLALCQKHDWQGEPSATGEGSYFAWLNQPCEIQGRDGYGQILITNLARQVHWLRPDLNQTFVDLQGPARADFADWFVRGGAEELELDGHFIHAMRQSLNVWACARSPEDYEAWAWWPKLPNFAVHLYRQSADLRAEYPDIKCFDRWSFLEWIVEHQEEANINPDFVKPVGQTLKKLAKLRSVGRYIPGARTRVAGV